MRVFNCPTWSAQDTFQAGADRFCGLAIGPDSHESIVRVGELLLQSGRVLALGTTGGYSITRHKVPSAQFSEISTLQILAFECAEEMAGEYARPNATFSNAITGTDVSGSAWTAAATVLDVPFIGRRQAMIALHNADVSKIGMLVLGRRYNASKRTVESFTLSTVNPGDFTGTMMALHIGGTNEAEVWHSLRIQCGQTGAADAVVFVDVECIGEIGVR